MPFARLTEFRYKQYCGGYQALRRIIKIRILPEARCVCARKDNGFGDDLGVLFALGFVDQLIRIGFEQIHVAIDEVQKVVAVGTGGISQVNDGDIVAVIFFCYCPVITHNVVE